MVTVVSFLSYGAKIPEVSSRCVPSQDINFSTGRSGTGQGARQAMNDET